MSKKKIPSPIQNVADLRPDPCNANLGTERGVAALARSLEAYGAGRAVLIDRHGVIIAGNKTVEQARRLNLPLHVVKTDGQHLIAVQREDLDLRRDPRARALAVADNRVGELDLEWNVEMLKHLREDGLDLSAFWTDVEFANLFDEAAGGLTDDDLAVEPAATNIARGDLFVLGKHRLLCGDATSPVDVERVLDGARPMLMPTDPPYGIEYQPGWRHRVNPSQRTAVGTVLNDDRSDWTPAWRLFPGAITYVWHAALKAGIVAASLEAAAFSIRSQIIWAKQHFAMSRGQYHWQHEPAWYAVKKGASGHWCGDRAQTTVWEVPNLNPMGGARTPENTHHRPRHSETRAFVRNPESEITRSRAMVSTIPSVGRARRSSRPKNFVAAATPWILIRAMYKPR